MMDFLYTLIILPIELLIELTFSLFYKAFKDYGLAIACISLFVSLATLPLYHVSDQMQKKERDQRKRLQPSIDRIKKSFKGDEQYMMLSTLYRQNHYHPLFVLRSSFGLLIQVPFFIAAYHFLSHLNQLNGQSFLFIRNLGRPDGLLSLGTQSVNILPILMTVINIVAGIIYTRGFPLRDKIQLYGMAGVFLVLLYNSPAGLVLYWTLNNVFSLIKNILYKLKHPLKVSYAAAVLSVTMFVILMFLTKLDLSVLKKTLLIGGWLVVVSLPIMVRIASSFIQLCDTAFGSNTKHINQLFVSSLFTLVLLSGLVIPANVISSSPIEFSYLGNIGNPLQYVFLTLVLFAGMFGLWPSLIYAISSRRIRVGIVLAVIALTTFALVNTYLFQGAYGIIDNMLVFDTPSLLQANRTQIMYPFVITIVILAVVFALLVLHRAKVVSAAFLVLVISSGISGIYYSYNIARDFKEHSRNVQTSRQLEITDEKINPIFTLSRNENNVVVLFLDRAISSYFPIIVEEFPETKRQYDGFTFYPNTVSYGAHTISGSPPMMGGYEYTPDEMNSRKSQLLVDKHNEASLVLPILFGESGYNVQLFDPPMTNYKLSLDYSIFKDYEYIDVMPLEGTLGDYYKENNLNLDLKTSSESSLLIKRLPPYVLFKLIPPVFRSLFYDEGKYFLMTDSPSQLRAFLGSYASLYYLPDLTDFDDNAPSYIFIGNDTTHRPIFLQAPEYTPQTIVTDMSNPLTSEPRYKSLEVMHYHINAASIKAIGKWLDYLRQEGVYDNTRIIIVADHGYDILAPAFMDFKNNAKYYAMYNPLLLVKDFDARGELSIDHHFMTNADVPLIALDGIVTDPINPFTQKHLEEQVSKEVVNVYKIPWRPEENKGAVFDYDPKRSFSVTTNIFSEDNWKPVGAFKE
jgi:YidC/Oxa1 family membrane protein insertase